MAVLFNPSVCCCGGAPPAPFSTTNRCLTFNVNWVFEMAAFPVAGRLGVIVVDAYKATGTPAAVSVAGWTLHYNALHHSSSRRIHVFTRLLDGSETTNITAGTPADYTGMEGAVMSLPVPSAAWDFRQATSSEYGSGVTVDIPQLTPAAGSYLLATASFFNNTLFSSFNLPTDAASLGCGSGSGSSGTLQQTGFGAVAGGTPTPSGYYVEPSSGTSLGVGLATIIGP